MIGGVAVGLGIPDHLFGIDGHAVHHRGDLAVASAGVEADAAAVQIPAHRRGGGIGLRRFGQGADFHGEVPLIHAAHEVRVERAGAAGGVGFGDITAQGLVAADHHFPAAVSPQQHFHGAFHIHLVRLIHGGGAVNLQTAHSHLALVALHGHGDVFAVFGGGLKGGGEGGHGDKPLVQHRGIFYRDLNAVNIHRGSSSIWNAGARPSAEPVGRGCPLPRLCTSTIAKPAGKTREPGRVCRRSQNFRPNVQMHVRAVNHANAPAGAPPP